jgi:hypothetical protein
MKSLFEIKIVSWALLAVMLTAMLHGIHESAHAYGYAGASAVQAELSQSQESPCAPAADHKDFDGCDACISCACHAPLAILPVNPKYDPIVSNLLIVAPYKHLPEVFLSKFIPPQNHA